MLFEDVYPSSYECNDVVPNSDCLPTMSLQQSSDVISHNNDRRPIMVTAGTPPFNILWVNRKWISVCGFCFEEVIGKSPKNLLEQKPFKNGWVINKKHDGSKFLHYFVIHSVEPDKADINFKLAITLKVIPFDTKPVLSE